MPTISLRDYTDKFDGIRFFSQLAYDKFWSAMKKEYEGERQNGKPIIGFITYQRSLERNPTLADDIATTLNNAIYETMKADGPQNTLFQVTMKTDSPILVHTSSYNLQGMKAVANVVISKVEEGSLCALTRDAEGNALYLHSNNFNGVFYELAVRRALEEHYDRYGEVPVEVPFVEYMPPLVSEEHKETPLPYMINAIKYLVRDDHLAKCVPYSDVMSAAAELGDCTPFRFGDDLMILNIFSPSLQEAKCLYENLHAFRRYKEELEK